MAIKKWQKAIIGPEATVKDAIELLTTTGLQICLVCDDDKRLIGTVTDGDIRRGIIRSLPLDVPVRKIMNEEPHVGLADSDDATLTMLMSTFRLRAIPILDSEQRIVDLRNFDEIIDFDQPHENPVVIMAGGLGKRLRPMTENLPKPLIPVGNKPLLETIVEGFERAGFHDIHISVHYKAEMIKDYFGSGEKWGVNIRYIEEAERLGTAGALRLFGDPPSQPLIVMNGDLLTRVDFEALLDYHHQQKSVATMCVREFDMQVPFGVVRTDGQQIVGIEEKPVQHYLVNAGIYVLNPELLSDIPKEGVFDMTMLFDQVVADGRRTAIFPIREYWLDIGRMDDLDKANWAYDEEFNR